ncbi:MAG: hypothetical protein U0235_00770 [Polyangiaceae bacterium]
MTPRVWKGAFVLLFTANFCAIILFSVVVFLLLAFDTVDVGALERDAEARAHTDRSRCSPAPAPVQLEVQQRPPPP